MNLQTALALPDRPSSIFLGLLFGGVELNLPRYSRIAILTKDLGIHIDSISFYQYFKPKHTWGKADTVGIWLYNNSQAPDYTFELSETYDLKAGEGMLIGTVPYTMIVTKATNAS